MDYELGIKQKTECNTQYFNLEVSSCLTFLMFWFVGQVCVATLEWAEDHGLPGFIKNAWTGFSIAQQILSRRIQRVSIERHIDPFAGQGGENHQNKQKINKELRQNTQPRLYRLISIPCWKDRGVL